MNDELTQRRRDLSASCRCVQGAEPEADFAELERVAAWCKANDAHTDVYGEGTSLESFEERVADMLGYPAARFMPTGTMAQQIAARIWSERSGVDRIGMHPTCHLELHEQRGYRRLHGLDVVLVGDAAGPMTSTDVANAAESMSTLIIELPTRENGGQLAPWDDLVSLCGSAREQGIATHLDGARLWEAAAGYGRPVDEICALFDSTYVSFYKGIGALPGSMLAGPADFIDEAKLWQRRHGGNQYTLMANWASAAMRLDAQIAKMPAYRDRAIGLAAALSAVDGIRINPAVPQVNMFHVFIEGERESLLLARDAVAEERDLWLFGGLQPTDVPAMYTFEVTVGDAAMGLEDAEIAAAFAALLAAA